jgi:predicted RNase H-like HicB family nuclease
MANKAPLEYLKEPYARVIVPEETGGYAAEILEFPGCFAAGETPEEAYQNLEGVAKEWIEAEVEAGREIPAPSDVEAFSGRYALRMPRGLHQQAARMAEREGTSLNTYIVTAIAARAGADDLFHRMVEKIETRETRWVFQGAGYGLRASIGNVFGPSAAGYISVAYPSLTVGTYEMEPASGLGAGQKLVSWSSPGEFLPNKATGGKPYLKMEDAKRAVSSGGE